MNSAFAYLWYTVIAFVLSGIADQMGWESLSISIGISGLLLLVVAIIVSMI